MHATKEHTAGRPGQCPIPELAEENMLHEYWQRKEEVEEKYRRLLADLNSEEAIEIKHHILKVGPSASPGCLAARDVVKRVSDEYDRTRALLLKQQLIELEELLTSYRAQIEDNI